MATTTKKMIWTRVDEDTAARCVEVAEGEGHTLSSWLRNLVKKALASKRPKSVDKRPGRH